VFHSIRNGPRWESNCEETNSPKRRLVVETPCVIRGRPLVVAVEASGLQLREKGRQSKIEISWAQIYNRAAEIAADRFREARRHRRVPRVR
jgi:hypothetical protein